MVRGGRQQGGGQRRPVIRKTAQARLSRYVPRAPIRVPRPEGIRYLRADGTPNFSQWLHLREGEVKAVASSPAIVVSTSANILEALEAMASKKARGLPIVRAGDEKLAGVVTALDAVNYLGGGEYYNIVVNRHKKNIYSALRDESIMSIANPTPVYATVTDDLDDVINLMFSTGMGFIPVTWEDGTVYGVITEHDIVKHYSGNPIGVTVGEVATRSLVTIDIEATIKEAAETMVKHGFRRLPVVGSSGEDVKGVISAKDIVYFFGSHEAFKTLESTNIEEPLSTPVYELMTPEFYTISEDEDVGVAAKEMSDNNVSFLLVVDENDNVKGIITERDILNALIISAASSREVK